MDNTYIIIYERYDIDTDSMKIEEMRVVDNKVEVVFDSLIKNGYKVTAVLQWCPPV